MILALPTCQMLDRLSGRKVIDLGAGTGLWVRILSEHGIDAIGIDPIPRGEGVVRGNHRDVRALPDRDLLMIVWPPDGTDLAEWVRGWTGDVLVVGSFGRFSCPDLPVQWEMELPPGYKGGNSARLMRAGVSDDRAEV